MIPFECTPLTLADVTLAQQVEQAAYPHGYSPHDYAYDLQHNPLAHYLALRCWLPAGAGETGLLIGVTGYWLLADEAHIITVAVLPRRQRLGLGEFLLLALIEQAHSRGARLVTLEVRPSNRAALALYKKYGFEPVGRRRRYYRDTGEDALLYNSPPLAQADYQAELAGLQRKVQRRLAKIEIDKLNQIG